jgi:uncharacterized protein (DUF1778 family)
MTGILLAARIAELERSERVHNYAIDALERIIEDKDETIAVMVDIIDRAMDIIDRTAYDEAELRGTIRLLLDIAQLPDKKPWWKRIFKLSIERR